MKKVPFALVLAFGLASGSAFAATQGTVTINGKIVDQTCEIVSGDEVKAVTLATVSVTSFDAPGQILARQPFTIGLENCTVGANVYAAFSAPVLADLDSATFTLKNKATGTAATGVNIVLTEQDQTIIKLNDPTYPPSTMPVTTTATTATLTYAAAYYATSGTVTAGDVKAVANYVIAYQ